jgi:hypothetical protein
VEQTTLASWLVTKPVMIVSQTSASKNKINELFKHSTNKRNISGKNELSLDDISVHVYGLA